MIKKQILTIFFNDIWVFSRRYIEKWLLWAGLLPILLDYIGTYIGWAMPEWFPKIALGWLIFAAFFAAFDTWREANQHGLSYSSTKGQLQSIADKFKPDLGAIPAPPGVLVGRDELEKAVHERLNLNQNISLHGMGGIGKTAIAAKVALERFKKGEKVFWIKAERRTPNELYEEIARRLGDRSVVHLSMKDKRMRVRELINQIEIDLIVLDDVWNPKSAREAEYACPAGCRLLVTGRERAGAGFPFDVTQLNNIDSGTLFRYHAGLPNIDIDVKPIVYSLGGHPMALEIAGKIAYRKALTPEQLVERINKIGQRVKALSLGKQAKENVWASLLISVDALPKLMKTVFTKIGGLWSTSITKELLSIVTELSSEKTAEVISILASHSLLQAEITPDGITRYRMHDLTFDVALVMFNERNVKKERKMLVAACCTYAERYVARVREAHDRLESELSNLLGASKWAFENALYQETNDMSIILWTSSEFLRLRGYVVEAKEIVSRGVEAAEKLHKLDDKVTQLTGLGIIFRQLGQQTQAIKNFESALNLARKIKDPLRESKAVGDLGWAHYRLGNVNTAIKYLNEAIDAVQIAQDMKWEGVLLGTFGRLYTDIGQTNKAHSYLQKALSIANKTDDVREAERHIGSLGIIFRLKGQSDEAISYLNRSLNLSKEIGDIRGEGRNLGHLGLANFSKGEIEKSIDYLEKALKTHRKAGDPRREGYRLNDLGRIYLQLDQVEIATKYFEGALQTAKKIKDQRGYGEAVLSKGILQRVQGQIDEAKQTLNRVLDIHQSVKNLRAESETFLELAKISVQQNEWEKAEKKVCLALPIAQSSEYLELEGFCLGEIGKVHMGYGDFDKAEIFFNQALTLHRSGGMFRGVEIWQKCLGDIGILRSVRGKTEKSRRLK
jgi:tetratricopeptide (TPR) repeat protein